MHKRLICEHLTAWALLGVLFQYHPVLTPFWWGRLALSWMKGDFLIDQ